ncbi:AI-2 transport protein TqsA [Stieleria varia]|uniref:AI-2 transport protein TqsA n=2 Tax=Stieleria varia TaxID=2528005 RepID=A0A5C6B089_9BACT|nr:AI-2 transport protein TqsA [Stieleria varia]
MERCCQVPQELVLSLEMADIVCMMQLSNKDSYGRIQMICQMVLAVVALTYSIYWLRPVLVPLVVALFVVSGVSPILTMLENRLGVSRIIAAGLTFLAGVVLLIVFGLSIWVSMVDLKNNSQAYRQRVEEIVHWGESRFREIGLRVEQNTSAILPTIDSERKGNEIDEATATEISPEISSVESPDAMTERSAKGKAEMSEFVDTLVRDGIGMISQALISLVSTSMVVLIYVFFLLIGTPSNSHHSSMVREIDHQVRSYLSLKTVISIFTGLAFGISLHLFGVPMAFTFGVLAFLLNFVPNIGPIVASLLPVPLIILDPDGSILWMAGAISVTCAIQVISGNLIEPKIMGNSSDLHPVTILVALMFWGMMWGVIGMFLATPITAAIKILLQRFDSTRPAADLMAGRWPASEDATAIA